jgi:hypothetical protein
VSSYSRGNSVRKSRAMRGVLVTGDEDTRASVSRVGAAKERMELMELEICRSSEVLEMKRCRIRR